MAIRPERITLPRNMAQIGRKDDTEVTITKHQQAFKLPCLEFGHGQGARRLTPIRELMRAAFVSLARLSPRWLKLRRCRTVRRSNRVTFSPLTNGCTCERETSLRTGLHPVPHLLTHGGLGNSGGLVRAGNRVRAYQPLECTVVRQERSHLLHHRNRAPS
jgi:hypothetical protein